MKMTIASAVILLAIASLFPQISFAIQSEKQSEIAMVKPEIMAKTTQPIGNITFTRDNRKIFSVHPFFKPGIRVAELVSQIKFKPFPNTDWNTPKADSDLYFDDVLGLRADENGIVWILDMGNRSHITPKIVGWNTKSNQLERIYYIPHPISLDSSQLNDLVVDSKNQAFYIADEDIGPGGDGSKGALIVVDMKTGSSRRLLQSDVSTKAEQIPVMIQGKPLMVPGKDGKARLLTIGNDGIAADKDFQWLYYGPMNGLSLYRLRIDDLLNDKLSNKDLADKVERYSEKTINGGISIDQKGNIYSTEPEHKAVGIIPASSRHYQQYVVDPELEWPDGLSFAPDGYMYVSDSQIDKSALCNQGKALNKAPYLLFRFKPLAPGRVGF